MKSLTPAYAHTKNVCTHVHAAQGWTLAPARPPMAGNFHCGQVNFDKYQPGWQVLFLKVKQIPVMGRLKTILGFELFKVTSPTG